MDTVYSRFDVGNVLEVRVLLQSLQVREVGWAVCSEDRTELLFSTSAFSLCSSLRIPFSFNGAISIESVFLCFTKVQSLLLFEF